MTSGKTHHHHDIMCREIDIVNGSDNNNYFSTKPIFGGQPWSFRHRVQIKRTPMAFRRRPRVSCPGLLGRPSGRAPAVEPRVWPATRPRRCRRLGSGPCRCREPRDAIGRHWRLEATTSRPAQVRHRRCRIHELESVVGRAASPRARTAQMPPEKFVGLALEPLLISQVGGWWRRWSELRVMRGTRSGGVVGTEKAGMGRESARIQLEITGIRTGGKAGRKGSGSG